MKYRLTKNQIELIQTSFESIKSEDEIMLEQKLFKVYMRVGTYNTQIVVFSANKSSARIIAGKLFKNAKIYKAEPMKGKIC